MPRVVAKARCLPTEDSSKVRKAILNLFPSSETEELEGSLVAITSDLERFKELIRNYRILDSTRKVLLRGVMGRSTIFHVNKQAAFVGKVSFVDRPTPLGSIEVSIEDDDIEKLIDRISPVTVNGEEVAA